MPKPKLKEPYRSLEFDIMDTMKAGLRQWRPDLDNPESASDWQACIRGLLTMYEVRRRPLAIDLPLEER